MTEPLKKPRPPVSVRLPDTLHDVLKRHLDSRDLVRSRFIRAAITEKLRRERSVEHSPPNMFPK